MQDFAIAEVFHHEKYSDPNPFQNDIAIIKLDRPATFNGWKP